MKEGEGAMTPGLDQRMFVENGPTITAARSQLTASSASYRVWRGLSPDRRLAAVERRLNAVNDLIDGFPLAL